MTDIPTMDVAELRQGVAKIVTNSGAGLYKVTEQWYDPSASQWDDSLPPMGHAALTSGAHVGVTARAYDDSASGTTDQLVRFWEQRAQEGALEILIDAGWQFGGMFAVKVWQDGGSEGSKTTQCTLTYKVRTIDATGPAAGGTQLATGKTPAERDWGTAADHYGKWKGPPSTGSGVIGLGYYNTSGTFVLYSASERRNTSVCA